MMAHFLIQIVALHVTARHATPGFPHRAAKAWQGQAIIMADKQFLEQLSRRLADDGKLIEAGWISLRVQTLPLDAPAVQLQNMRMAFMAGAQHLFASILTILEPGAEATDADLGRMELIHQELEAYRQELELLVAKPAGKA
jgi:hypothetical protein